MLADGREALCHLFRINVTRARNTLERHIIAEAAANLGCSGFRKFRRITLPLMMPGLFAGGTIVFIWAFTELGVPLIFDYTRVTPVQIFDGIKDLTGKDQDAKDEAAVLKRWLELSESETALKRAVKEQHAALDKVAYEKYPTLTEAEVKTLVVEDKWMARLAAAVQGELERVSQTITGRIRELAERYATPLPQLTEEVTALAVRVDGHLQKMGASWR